MALIVNFWPKILYKGKKNVLVTSSILLNLKKENLLLNYTYTYKMLSIDPYSMLLNYLLAKLEGQAQWPKIADSWTSLWLHGYIQPSNLSSALDASNPMFAYFSDFNAQTSTLSNRKEYPINKIGGGYTFVPKSEIFPSAFIKQRL